MVIVPWASDCCYKALKLSMTIDWFSPLAACILSSDTTRASLLVRRHPHSFQLDCAKSCVQIVVCLQQWSLTFKVCGNNLCFFGESLELP